MIRSTDDTGTVTPGHLEIELPVEFSSGSSGDITSMPLVLTFGLLENIDLGVGVPYEFHHPGDEGLGDINIFPKWRLIEEGVWPAFVIKPEIKLATGDEDKGLGSGEIDYVLTGVFTKESGMIISHLNLGYRFVGEAEGVKKDNVFSYGLAVDIPVRDRWNIVAEVTGETNSDPKAKDDPLALLGGLIYETKDEVVLSTGISAGLTDASPDYIVVTAITYEF